MKKMLMMFGVMLSAMVAFSADPLPEGGPYMETVGGIEWTFMVDSNLHASIGTGSYNAISQSTEGAVTIPTTLGGRAVTSIGNYAFHCCAGLTSVTIPLGVTSIGNYAFYGCSCLTSVTIPSSVSNIGSYTFGYCYELEEVLLAEGIKSMGECMFYECNSLAQMVVPTTVTQIGSRSFYNSGITNVVMSNGLLYIGSDAFCSCQKLTQVTIPSTVTNIGVCAFSGSGITNVVISQGVPSVGNQSFSGCQNLECVTIPSSVTNVGDWAFSACYSLTNVTIASGVVRIGNYAFSRCRSLPSVTIPSSVTSIGSYAFYGCSELHDILVSEGNDSYADIDGVLVSRDGMQLICFPTGRSGSYSIPAGVTSVGEFAFYCCSGVTEVTIPSNVISIGHGAFESCGLTNVTISEGVADIGGNAFGSCGMTNVTIPASVTNIGVAAFAWNDALDTVYFEGSPPNGWANMCHPYSPSPMVRYNVAYESAWEAEVENTWWIVAAPYVPGIVPLADGGPYTEVVDDIEWTFMVENGRACVRSNVDSTPAIPSETTGEITIPTLLGGNFVTDIGAYAFYYCSGLTSVSIPSKVTNIGDYAFYYCSSCWCSSDLPSDLVTVGDYAFYGCTQMNMSLPSSITDVGDCAFTGSGIGSIWLTEGKISIGEGAFAWCPNLSCLSVSKGVESITIGTWAFAGDSFTDIEILSAAADIGDYAFSDQGYCWYGSPCSVTLGGKIRIGEGAFSDAYDHTVDPTHQMNVQITKGEVIIGNRAFYKSGELMSVTIAEDVTSVSIGDEAFYQCTGLTDMLLPEGVTDIGKSAFSDCDGLMSITIPSSVTNIGYDAFAYSGITNVAISVGVTDIGNGAFCSCYDLVDVTIPLSVTNIGSQAFGSCINLLNVTMPARVTSIGDYAFAWCSTLESVTIPSNVTDIGSGAFFGCDGLTGVYIFDLAAWCYIAFADSSANPLYHAQRLYLNGVELTELVIPSDVTSIGAYAFYNCSSLTHAVISPNVTSVGTHAFSGCANLIAIDFEGAPPSGVSSAGINQSATIRYNVVHQSEWLPIIEACGWTNAKPYDPFAPTVTDVTAMQRYPWNGKVDITFAVSSVREEVRTIVISAVDRNTGITNVAVNVTGDVECTNGAHHVVWDMSEDGLALASSNVVFGVSYEFDETASVLVGSWSDEIPIDLTQGVHCAKKIEMLTYSTLWGADYGDDAIAEVAVNGTVVSAKSGCGVVEWNPKRDGTYELTHTVKTNGVSVGEILTAEFVASGINPTTPVISPASGSTFDYSLTVSMTCASAGATIHYTTDGTTPTMTSPKYKKFRIYERTVVKAIAFYENGLESDMAVAEYAPGRCENPVITPQDGTVFEHSGQQVSIAWEGSNGVLRVTMDGSDPTRESAEYAGPFTIDDTTTIKAKVFGDTWFDSAVTTAVLTRAWVKVATPEITAAGTFTGSKNKVTISCATEGAAIYYTLDGSAPTAQSARYEKPFCVTGSCTVKTMAVKDDYLNSDVATRSMTRKWSIGETMGKCDHTFATSGDKGFVRVDDATAVLGESMKSGDIDNNQTSILSTTVVGPGTLTFKWKTSCEEDYPLHEWDHAEFVLDGVVTNWLDGITEWVAVSQRIEGDGEHTIIWRYVKDGNEKEGDDCLWVSEYVWTSDYTTTQTTDNPVPYDWLTKKCCEVVDEYDNYEKVAKQTAYNPRFTVEQCFVAGLDPESTTNEFSTAIEMVDGLPVITWKPDLNEGGVKDERLYKIWGSTNLVSGGDWEWPTNALHRFFKVTVEMP